MNPAWRLQRADLMLLALIAVMLLATLGLYPLFDVDEGAFGEATRELLDSGDWLSTTLNGAPRFDKPILIYWLQALAVRCLGLNEFALRLPSGLAALCWSALVLGFARPRLGGSTAQLAAWICATSAGVLVIGHAATADALLNALLAAAMFDAWRHLEQYLEPRSGQAGQPHGGRKALRRCYLWVGLGVLTKGPIALLIPAAVTLLYALSCCAEARRWQPLRRWLGAAVYLPGWVVLLAVAGPWYALQLAAHGRAFVDGFIIKHNLQRFNGTLEGHRGSILYYVAFVPLLLLPWTGLLGATLRAVPRDWGTPLNRYLWLWCGFVIVFFSASGTKLPHYALYGMTPLFLLCAANREAVRRPAAVLAWPTAVLLLLPAAPWLLQAAAARLTGPGTAYYAALAQRSLAAAPLGYYVASGAAAAIWIALLARWRIGCWRLLALAAGLQGFVLGTALAPWLGEVASGPVKRAALAARALQQQAQEQVQDQGNARLPGGDGAVEWNINVPSFSVYRQQITPSRPPVDDELAIVRIDRLPQDAESDYQTVYREAGIALLRRRPQGKP